MEIRVATVLLAFWVTQAGASSRISLRTDGDDCVKGWISMDVSVDVNGERFEFDPSCNFSFDKSFKTREGLECEIHAGMCSAFSPRNKIEVRCKDGASVEANVDCPKK